MYPEWEMYDEKEEDRLEHVQIMKAKGKGPPKKNKTKVGMYILRPTSLFAACLVGSVVLMKLCVQRRRRRVGRSGSMAVVEAFARHDEGVEVGEERCSGEF